MTFAALCHSDVSSRVTTLLAMQFQSPVYFFPVDQSGLVPSIKVMRVSLICWIVWVFLVETSNGRPKLSFGALRSVGGDPGEDESSFAFLVRRQPSKEHVSSKSSFLSSAPPLSHPIVRTMRGVGSGTRDSPSARGTSLSMTRSLRIDLKSKSPHGRKAVFSTTGTNVRHAT